MPLIVFEDRAPCEVEAPVAGDALWLAPDDLARASGWEPKPEGLCRGAACVPVGGRERQDLVRADGRIDLAGLARRLGQPVVHDAAAGAWALGHPTPTPLPTGRLEAPEVTLADLDGRLHTLSDARGQKVLLVSWASWCGCRHDLPVWQALHEELGGEGLVVITVATDSGGPAAAGEWIRAARPTHPALLDPLFEAPRLFGMVNVPNAVWIDEEGTIVRPAETAGSTDAFRSLDRTTMTRTEAAASAIAQERERYLEAVRAWVRTGRYALPPEEARRRQRIPDALAATHFRLGATLHRRGDGAGAARHFAEAARLEPDNWNHRRQALALADSEAGQPTPLSALGASAPTFWAAVDALGERPFYPAARLDG